MLRSDELVGSTEGRFLFNDAPTQAVRIPEDQQTSVGRLRRATLLDVLDRYRAIGVKETVDEATGDVTAEDRTPYVRATIGAAWAEYAGQTSAPAGTSFRTYLEATPEQAEALGYLNEIRDMMAGVRQCGLSSTELETCQETMLTMFSPVTIERTQFMEAMEGESS